jgi:galacturonosyltransferase
VLKTIISNTDFSIINFRTELIREFLEDNHEVLIVCEVKSYASELENLGVRIVNIPYPRKYFDLIGFVLYFIQIQRLIKKHKPDLLLTFTIIPNIVACWLRKIYPFKLICNVTGFGRIYSEKDFKSNLLMRIYKKSLCLADFVFVQNKKDYLILASSKIKQLQILPGSGVSLSKLYSEYFPISRITILFIGRILEGKGVEYLIKIAPQFPQYDFRFVGFPELSEEHLITKIEKITNSYPHIAYIPGTKDPFSEIINANVVCLPSLYGEGTPRSLIEGLAAGKIIITTNVAGASDCVDNNVNGFLLNINNIEYELKLALERLATFTDSNHRIAYEHSKKLSKNYAVENVIDQYQNAIKTIKIYDYK